MLPLNHCSSKTWQKSPPKSLIFKDRTERGLAALSAAFASPTPSALEELDALPVLKLLV